MAFQRLNYFTGQFLREDDFKKEQTYHLSMRRMHNSRVHTPGIVHGLEVIAGTSQVIVRAGMAIDKDGREIVLEADTTKAVSAGDINAYLVIALEEKKTDMAPVSDPVRDDTRWTESPVLNIVAAVPAGAIGLAQVAAVAGNGAVTLNSTFLTTYSAPVVEGDLTVGRDLTVEGNLTVQGETTVVNTEKMQGNVVLGDADTDTVTIEGSVQSGHTSGSLQIASPVVVNGNVSAVSFSGNGSALTGISATDNTKVTKTGDTMTGRLSITAGTVSDRISKDPDLLDIGPGKFVVTSSGLVTMPQQSSFRVYKTQKQGIIPNTDTLVTFEGNNFDKRSEFGLASSRFIVGNAGIYLLFASIGLEPQPLVPPAQAWVKFFKNGKCITYSLIHTVQGKSCETVQLLDLQVLKNGDYIEVIVNQNTDSGMLIMADETTYFFGVKML